MSNTITLEIPSIGDITIRKPDFGYLTSINMRLHAAKQSQRLGAYTYMWDDGSSYDSRKCTINKWLINKTEQEDFIDFINSYARRYEYAILKLGSTPSGFFPFGADLGDKGDFYVRIFTNGYKEGGQLYDPLRWWENSVTFGLKPDEALPSYTPPAAENEGSLQIGTVAHLLCPQSPIEPEHERAIASAITGNGDVDFIDKTTDGDNYETVIPLEMRNGNCAALITYLTGASGRAQTFQIMAPTDLWPFGIQYDSEVYELLVKLTNGLLEITHVNYQQFLMKLKLKLISATIPG